MRVRRLREDSEGVASTVATVFSILLFLIFFQIAVFGPIPAQQYDAEWRTSREALAAFGLTRSILAGPATVGTTFTVPIPIGTPAVSPFATASPGFLEFRGAATGPTISFRYVPDFLRSEVARVDQDIILAIDSSGSMVWNDEFNLRISGAQEYVGKLRCPDRVAIVDFDSDAWLTRRNIGRQAHHLSQPGHNCVPDYTESKGDLATIDSNGGTNFGAGLQVSVDELVAYGDHRHQWIIILLTDGMNNQASWDANALAQSIRAAGLGIIIYTIGLGDTVVEPDDVDEAILTEIAENTGGTYYAAPDAASIRWIYLEIANRYQSSFICSEYVTADASAGSVSLTLGSGEFPAQSIRLEGGALSLVQHGGAELRDGLPFEYLPVDQASGSIGLTLISFIGEDIAATGTDPEILRATVVGRDVVAQTVHRINLTEESQSVQDIKDDLTYWKDQGAATILGVQAVADDLDPAKAAILDAQADYIAGDPAGAKTDVARAQTHLADAMEEVDTQVATFQIQNWLGESTKDEIRVTACRLDQWRNWYDGLTFTIDSPAAAGWARWFEDALKAAGARVSVGLVGNHAVLTVRAINEYVIDHRLVELSFGI
jgi:hypothetical protein